MYYLCNKCCYLHRDTIPEKCEVCSADSSHFTPVSESVDKYIPDYYKEMIDEKCEKIRALNCEAGHDAICFGLVTDIHWGPNQKHSAAIIKEVCQRCDISYVINGGDVISGAGLCDKKTITDDFDAYKKSFADILPKMLYCMGNHDPSYSTLGDKNYYAENLTEKEIYEYYFRSQAMFPDRVMSKNGTYYYVDDPSQKTRYIILNPHEGGGDDVLSDGKARINKMWQTGITKEQLLWFANVALDVKDGYTVILAAHESPVHDCSFKNIDLILGVIKAFKDGGRFEGSNKFDVSEYDADISVDFKGKKGSFALWVSGHTHYDDIACTDGIFSTCTTCDWPHNVAEFPFKREIGTPSEHAIDFFCINRKTGKVNIVRIGAGVDREISL